MTDFYLVITVIHIIRSLKRKTLDPSDPLLIDCFNSELKNLGFFGPCLLSDVHGDVRKLYSFIS